MSKGRQEDAGYSARREVNISPTTRFSRQDATYAKARLRRAVEEI
jgi:hypothetical protein